jgi:tripartite-type tricarboxylate transporter receptor subunit TctC
MKLERRQFLQFAALAAALPAATQPGRTQTYPSRPVRLIVGYPPGSTSDKVARITGQWLSLRLGQPVVIENHRGVAAHRAAQAFVRAPADGYTLLLISAANAIDMALYRRPAIDLRRDIVPVAAIARGPMVVAVDPSFPAKTFPEFLAYVLARPSGSTSVASVGVGSASQLVSALRIITGVYVTHERRDSALAIHDLLSGRVQAVFGAMTAMTEYINGGQLRALAVTAPMRVEALPDVPTVAETIPGYEASDWFGIGAPNGTPVDVIDSLNREINAAFFDPTMTAQLTALHGTLLPGSAEDFARLIADETELWDSTFYREWYDAVRRYRPETGAVA